MKRIFTAAFLILFCILLTSCSAGEALKYSISGDLIDPVDGFSLGEEKGTFVYKDNKYILLQEINGSCEVNITEEDILLGYSSNYPFSPNSYYYVNTEENPSFIMGGNSAAMVGVFVYLREDIHNNGIVYVLNDSSFEFEFTSAFLETDEVDYDYHIAGNKFTKCVRVDFYMKEIPTITVCKRIYLIDDTWYCVQGEAAYQLSEEFLGKLMEKGILS